MGLTADQIRRLARGIGFDDAGVSTPESEEDRKRFTEWLDRGYHGSMNYMFRHRKRRLDPNRIIPNIQSIIMVALDYDTSHPRSTEVPQSGEKGWISRYAWGDDYHDVMEPMLDRLCDVLSDAAPGYAYRHYVDHGPVLEKVYARQAGLGWMGKHTNIIHPKRGSYFFLAAILTDLPIAPDAPIQDHCGSCTACLDACPTNAFPEPYVLDARRCISYLTIESKSSIPTEFHQDLGPHMFGCDICQDVCPWNIKPIPPDRPAFQPRPGLFHPDLQPLSEWTPEQFQEKLTGSPLERRGHEGLMHTIEVIRGEQSSE